MREGAETPALYIDEIPEQLATRLVSVRAFDRDAMMTNAEVIEGNALEPLIGAMFADPDIAFLHVHNAKRGCFAARVDRS